MLFHSLYRGRSRASCQACSGLAGTSVDTLTLGIVNLRRAFADRHRGDVPPVWWRASDPVVVTGPGEPVLGMRFRMRRGPGLRHRVRGRVPAAMEQQWGA